MCYTLEKEERVCIFLKHSVLFDNVSNRWDNALPLGNGCFGAMMYYKNNYLYMFMNHYEVYYNIKETVLPDDILKTYVPSNQPGKFHDETFDRAERNNQNCKEPYCDFRTDIVNAFDQDDYGIMGYSGSYPSTGNIKFSFSDTLKKADHVLTLFVEDAKCKLSIKNGEEKMELDTIILREDCVVNHIRQTTPNLITAFSIDFLPYRDFDYPEITYTQVDSVTFVYTVKRMLNKDKLSSPFVFSGIIRLVGAEGKLNNKEYGAEVVLENTKNDFYILTGIFTNWKYNNPFQNGLEVINEYELNLDNLQKKHKEYWTDFFGRSSIDIPDKFLEHVYYVNQYALDCCSGKDGIMKHHACGLNGLWDIKHPNLWGSMWYWDVNIQSAFAGVFSSNRLDLAKVFSDGLLSYVKIAENSARDIHNVDGIAGDYPYSFYYCCWPWCAQYLWFLYEYSLDKDYLKNDAFPVFVKLSEFFLNIFKYDEERGYYSVYPDVSPEQGPLTHDSTITVASVKYLFNFTIEAAKILGEDLPILKQCKEIMNNMAPYALSQDGMYGVHIKDSADAPDNLWLRHTSLLMPIFPIGEFDLTSDKETLKILSNTINYLEDRSEFGIFGGSWIAASAARIGRGQTALRLLYERGIDHMLRSNGLTAEETDHFINYCLVGRQPLYYPCMMEFTGEMLVAVNEMLLQSHNNIIRVFPAIPDGDPEYYRSFIHGYSINEYIDRFRSYDAWDNISFDKLLAKGAFEISAQMKDKKLDYIKIHSKKGGKVNVTSPFMWDNPKVFCDCKAIDFYNYEGVLSFKTDIGKEYIIASDTTVNFSNPKNNDYKPYVLSRLTYTKRNIFIGGDSESQYKKAVDYFIRDWYMGNVRIENRIVYKFDFTKITGKKYSESFLRQACAAGERVMRSLSFKTFENDNLNFTVKQGYGFFDSSKIEFVERKGPDTLRRDFVQSAEQAEFIIEVPRGQYDILVVSGDDEEDNITVIEAVNGRKTGGEVIQRGQYQCKQLSVILEEDDEPIRLKMSTQKGYKWKINYILVNAVKGY